MATYVVNADTSSTAGEYQLHGLANDWPTAREAPTTILLSGLGAMVARGVTGSFPWTNGEGFVQFDTSVIDTTSIVSAGLRVNNLRSEFWLRTLQVRVSSAWSYPLVESDYVPGSTLAVQTLSGSKYIGADAIGVHAVPILVSTVNTSGLTKYVLHDDRAAIAATPTDQLGSTRTANLSNPGLSAGPRLIVHTVQPSTLMGVHDAAVQLSDGSTFYLEHDVAGGRVYERVVDTTGAISTWGNFTTSNAFGQLPIDTLQSVAVAVDAEDLVYIIRRGNNPLTQLDIYTYNLTTFDGSQKRIIGTHKWNNISATFCDAGNGTSGKGRILLAGFDADTGEARYLIINCGDAPPDNLWSGDLTPIDSGTNPSWLVSSSLYRNASGTGLSLATDVLGGTRVGVFSWSNNALTSTDGTVTYQTRAARLTVGSTISNVTTVTLPTNFYLANQYRGKVVSYGADQFVVAWNTATGVSLQRIGTLGTQTMAGATYFDIVYDPGSEAVWAYYWDSVDNTKLMRRPYYPATSTLGTAELVTTFAQPGTRDFIRTVKYLRDSQHVQVHYNVTN